MSEDCGAQLGIQRLRSFFRFHLSPNLIAKCPWLSYASYRKTQGSCFILESLNRVSLCCWSRKLWSSMGWRSSSASILGSRNLTVIWWELPCLKYNGFSKGSFTFDHDGVIIFFILSRYCRSFSRKKLTPYILIHYLSYLRLLRWQGKCKSN